MSRVLVAVAAIVLASSSSSLAIAQRAPTVSAGLAGPCGTMSGTPGYQHVVIVMDENTSASTLAGSAQATYLHTLAAQCGSETFMHAATHPSQPNYMALASGQATGVGVRPAIDNVFHQVQAAGLTWRSYEESMPAACSGNAGAYKSGHNPAFWYTDLRSPSNTCSTFDLPMSSALDNAISSDSLPSLSWITPNACDDMHWLSLCAEPKTQRIAVGDGWLQDLIPRLTAMPSYGQGRTLIVVTWDEGDGKEVNGSDCTSPSVYGTQPSCQIPTFIVSPYVSPGRTDQADHNLYGLLGDVEDILGLPRLGHAVGQQSLRPGLGF